MGDIIRVMDLGKLWFSVCAVQSSCLVETHPVPLPLSITDLFTYLMLINIIKFLTVHLD